MAQPQSATQPKTEQLVTDVLATIDREREREIVARRFGLFDRKETLEQIGEMLGITRERVRQLEKAVVTRLRTTAEQGSLPHIEDFQAQILELLAASGQVARVSELTAKLSDTPNREEQARVAFLSQLSPKLAVVAEDDNFYYSVGVRDVRDETAIKDSVTSLIEVIKKIGEPQTIEQIAKAATIGTPDETAALASTSKHLAATLSAKTSPPRLFTTS
jgi:hypothetical protein